MNLYYKMKISSISNQEFLILETINNFGPCSPWQINDRLSGKADLLLTMRAMHKLIDRNLLERVVVGSQKLYMTKANFNTIQRLSRLPLLENELE